MQGKSTPPPSATVKMVDLGFRLRDRELGSDMLSALADSGGQKKDWKKARLEYSLED